jgi:hypothetical protein
VRQLRNSFLATLAALAVALLTLDLSGCAKQEAAQSDDKLAEAGFVAMRTPEVMAAARGKPAHKFIWRMVGGTKTYYWYDPASCGCVYQGNQAAYDKFRQEMRAQRLMYEEELGESQGDL